MAAQGYDEVEEHAHRMALTRRWVSTCITCLTLAGCAAPGQRAKPGGEPTSPAAQVFRKIDPTGAAERNIRLSEASEAIKQRLDELDVDGFNQAVAAYGALAQQVNAQITALADELRESLTTGLDEAQLGVLSRKLQDAADEASAALAQLDSDGLNRAIADTHRLVTQIDEKIAKMDVAAANRLVTDASSLQPDIVEVLRESSLLVNDLRQTVDSLPIAGLNDSIARIDATVASIGRTFWLLQILAVLAIAAILLLAFCALAWLRRRPRA